MSRTQLPIFWQESLALQDTHTHTHTLPLWRDVLNFLLFSKLLWMPVGKVAVVTQREACCEEQHCRQLALIPLCSVNHCSTQPDPKELQLWAMSSLCWSCWQLSQSLHWGHSFICSITKRASINDSCLVLAELCTTDFQGSWQTVHLKAESNREQDGAWSNLAQWKLSLPME